MFKVKVRARRADNRLRYEEDEQQSMQLEMEDYA